MKTSRFLAVAALAAVALFTAGFAPDLMAAGTAAFVQASAHDPGVLFSIASGPTLLARSIHQAYERKGEGDDDSGPAMVEVKRVLDKLGRAFEDFKSTNETLIKAKADGKAVGELEAKLSTLSAAIDKFTDTKEAMEQALAKANRPDFGSDQAAVALAEEAKSFNLHMRADYQSKGKALPAELDSQAYAQYKSGYFKLAGGVSIDALSADERKAMTAGSDADGGYLMPASTVGRTVAIIREQSIMRQICDVQTIAGDKTEGILDNDEASAGWVAEIGTRSETGTPQVGKWEIQVHEMYAAPKVSQKLIDDAAVDVEGWLAAKVADKFGRIEGLAWWQGTSAGQPRGLAMYPTVATGDDTRAWGQFQHIVSGANGAFHTTQFDPLQDLQGAMKDHFLQHAQWVMRREVRTAARKLKEGTTNRYLWEPGLQVGQPERLNGYPVRVDQYMPALATNSLSLAFGDFKQAYTILDRIGIRTLRDPYTAKPYVVFYSTKRAGGGAMNFEAVKFLKFST